MYAWEAIQKTLEYIEDNIYSSHTIENLAKTANLSPFYYQRLFSRLVKKPVIEYIKLRKLARSSEALKDKNKRILEIAIDYGFADHSLYTKNFKTVYGITPEEYRKNPSGLNHFIKPDLSLNYIIVDENVPLIANEIVLEISRQNISIPQRYVGFVGEISIAKQIPVGEATGLDVPGQLWGKFHKEKSKIKTLKTDGKEIAVSYPCDKEGYFNYFVGSESTSKDSEYENWDLSAGEYIICKIEAESFEELVTVALDKAIKYIGGWLKDNKITTKPYMIEMYTGKNLDPPSMEIWVLTN